MVDLVCPPGEKMTRLGQIADLGSLVADVEVLPPSLEDIYSHFSGKEVP
jgi:Cu-processing system ATP-binding protein